MDVILSDLIHILIGSMRFPTMTRMLLYYGLSWFNLMWTWLWYVMSREMMTYCFKVCLWGSLEKTSLPIGGLRNEYDFPHSVYPWSYQAWAQIIKKADKRKIHSLYSGISGIQGFGPDLIELYFQLSSFKWHIDGLLDLHHHMGKSLEKLFPEKSVSIPQTY